MSYRHSECHHQAAWSQVDTCSNEWREWRHTRVHIHRYHHDMGSLHTQSEPSSENNLTTTQQSTSSTRQKTTNRSKVPGTSFVWVIVNAVRFTVAVLAVVTGTQHLSNKCRNENWNQNFNLWYNTVRLRVSKRCVVASVIYCTKSENLPVPCLHCTEYLVINHTIAGKVPPAVQIGSSLLSTVQLNFHNFFRIFQGHKNQMLNLSTFQDFFQASGNLRCK